MKPSLMRTRLRGRIARMIRKRQGPDSLPLILAPMVIAKVVLNMMKFSAS